MRAPLRWDGRQGSGWIEPGRRDEQSARDVAGRADPVGVSVDEEADMTMLSAVDLQVPAHRVAVVRPVGEVEPVRDQIAVVRAHIYRMVSVNVPINPPLTVPVRPRLRPAILTQVPTKSLRRQYRWAPT